MPQFCEERPVLRFPPLLVTEASWGDGSCSSNWNHYWLLFYLEGVFKCQYKSGLKRDSNFHKVIEALIKLTHVCRGILVT